MLSDDQKKVIDDLAIGQNVNAKIPIEDQIAALREQVGELSTATKTPVGAKMLALDTTVAEEKAKMGRKAPEEPKKKAKAKSKVVVE